MKHRIGAPAVLWWDGDTEWWENGKYHRLDGPAIDYDADQRWHWYQHGKLHRIDGPAEIFGFSPKDMDMIDFWLNGECLTFDDWIIGLETLCGGSHAMKMKLKWSAHVNVEE